MRWALFIPMFRNLPLGFAIFKATFWCYKSLKNRMQVQEWRCSKAICILCSVFKVDLAFYDQFRFSAILILKESSSSESESDSSERSRRKKKKKKEAPVITSTGMVLQNPHHIAPPSMRCDWSAWIPSGQVNFMRIFCLAGRPSVERKVGQGRRKGRGPRMTKVDHFRVNISAVPRHHLYPFVFARKPNCTLKNMSACQIAVWHCLTGICVLFRFVCGVRDLPQGGKVPVSPACFAGEWSHFVPNARGLVD